MRNVSCVCVCRSFCSPFDGNASEIIRENSNHLTEHIKLHIYYYQNNTHHAFSHTSITEDGATFAPYFSLRTTYTFSADIALFMQITWFLFFTSLACWSTWIACHSIFVEKFFSSLAYFPSSILKHICNVCRWLSSVIQQHIKHFFWSDSLFGFRFVPFFFMRLFIRCALNADCYCE